MAHQDPNEGSSMRPRQFTVALIAGLFVTLGHLAIAGPADTPSLDGTAWILKSLGGRTPAVGATATLRFDGGRVQGTDGCNRYSAPVAMQGAHISIGPRAATTNMACPPDIMKQADGFMAALTSAARYRVSGGALSLLGGDGVLLATFAPQPQSLAGSSWRATGINNGKGGVVSVLADTNVTMSFARDGKVAGSAGCNNYTTTFQEGGGALTFMAAAATRRMCATPGVMEQEQSFLKALESVATMRMEGDDLELRTKDGALAVELRRSPES
jgi:heat shock protein HslJ